jgi:hypothetical protein
VEPALYAPAPGRAEGLGDDVRRVCDVLRADAGLRARVQAAVAPRSTTRVARQMLYRYTGLAGKWKVALRRVLARHA